MTNEIFEKYGTDPIALYKQWLDEAEKTEPNDPDAACLATVNTKGQPSARMILIKDVSEHGLKFHTNEESRKGHDLLENPHAALCIYWKSLRKQIRIEGTVKHIDDAEADEYFFTRSTERQIGAWASKQSQPFDHRADLDAALEKYGKQFTGVENIPRPPYWKGYRLNPSSIEFWIGQKDRVHTRFLYTHKEDGTWTATWLCP